MKTLVSCAVALFLLGGFRFEPAAQAQSAKKSEAAERTVQGVVSDGEGAVISGAVVQIKNLKSLQIRSFITREQGDYFFNGLSPDVDYEINAAFKGKTSVTKTLSSFDSRKKANLNFKLDK